VVRADADLYDYLATSKVSEVTIAQLEQALENSFINKTNIEFWKGAITVHRLLEVSRTYPWGLPIPEKSATTGAILQSGETLEIQPTGTEVWSIIAIDVEAESGTPVVTISAYDGTSTIEMHRGTSSTTASSFFPWESPLPVTPTGYLQVKNTDGSDSCQVGVLYHVVGL
jgi:hypothetical protein